MLASNSRIFRIFNFTLCFILSCQTPFFPFRSTVRSASLHVLLVCRIPLHSPLAVPTSPALGHDSPGSVLNFLHILCLIRGCETLLRHYSISICLYTGALAYCIRHVQQPFKGLCGTGETTRSGGLCAVTDQLHAS